MKTINKYSCLLVGLLILLAACDNFDDINTNPDTTTRVPASMLCTNVILEITKFGGDAKAYIATNALPKYVAYANEGKMAEQYNRLGNGSFWYYTILPKLEKMLEYAEGDIYEDGYKGVAHFVKAYILYDMTMAMGDIPNTDAGKGDGDFRPAYDTQESIFISIIEELKMAVAAFKSAGATAFPGDPVYDGDPAKWQKASASFALKVLMALSRKADESTLNVKADFADFVTNYDLFTDNEDNFLVSYADDVGKYHPLYDQQKFTSNTLISSLLIDMLKELEDYRLFYYAEPSIYQLENGMSENDMDAYVGVDVEKNDDVINQIFISQDYSQLNNRYHSLKRPEPLALISYAEQNLLIAEAIERGWITGSSQQYYEEGVKAALRFIADTDAAYAHGMPITEDYITTYFSGPGSYKNTQEDRLEQIWQQKYLLHFMQDAHSSYFEYRRTRYPEFPVDPATTLNEGNKNDLPMRWLYPAGETSTNRENLEKALERQYEGYDEINKLMWLLK